ncbi:MAG: hypothetical protein AUI16_29785 [Alphaproteobacteria bacterium 13_2_20CM_2_64_7]|jgi:hypothetical protein|nr:MAG: hypothetical protein AUI16_29785 [Alphaproteobacteria bacterium 13_2_20CM_2_64_7]
MGKYTEAEKTAIMMEARATSAAVGANMQRWKAEKKQRDGAPRRRRRDARYREERHPLCT